MKHLKLLIALLIGVSSQVHPQDEAFICRYLFSSSNAITELSTETISLAVDAVWEASELNNNVLTTHGTLTQNPSNPNVWTYSPNPSDKLVLNFSSGVSIIFTFTTFNGYFGGTAEDFKWSHLMNFNTYIQNYMDLTINSNTYPQGGKIYWTRSINGTATFDNQLTTQNITHTGNIQYDIGSGYAFYTYTEKAIGTSASGTFSINVNEDYWRFIGNNSNLSTFVMNTEIINNSSGNFGGVTYTYQNGRVFWAAASVLYGGYYDKVVDAGQWVAQGSMLRNGQVYGNIQFDGPVINGTYGPNLVLHLNNGSNIFLHTLINMPVSVTDEHDPAVMPEITISQNYPNPFNSSTNIRFEISKPSRITAEVYDILGNRIRTLLNDEERPAGMHELDWNAGEIPSGVYFCRIRVSSDLSPAIIRTIKMTIIK